MHSARARTLALAHMREGTALGRSARWALTCGLLMTGACADPDPVCAGSCEGRACGDDGCGVACGTCAPDQTCSLDGLCLDPEPLCQESCSSQGAVCGQICGEVCGECAGAQEACELGQCVCAPACEGQWCTDSDGCDGDCGPCPNDQNCDDCVLQLHVVDQTITSTGQVTDVTLGLDYVGAFSGGPATMADIRMTVDGPASLQELEVGAAITNTGKDLQVDPDTGEKTLVLPDGTLRWAVISTEDQTPLGEGRWLTMRFRMGAAFEPAQLPGVFTLRDEEVILTPGSAQAALAGSGVTTPVVVWYEAVEETQ
ncbi:MAG: hypothetical protein CL940_08770 [Deltaproteobacteria bacterium]|nr:hypothetical protein [Deltaproteobacteria bacterium]